MQIMLVEDDALLADGIVRALKRDGFTVNWLSDGRSVQTSLVAEAPDVLVLDLGLPDMDGLQLLSWLRGKGLQMPVLILTARDSISDKVAGLDKGADDYLASRLTSRNCRRACGRWNGVSVWRSRPRFALVRCCWIPLRTG
jgi:DNA-binding response OmpR family regulator